MRISDWSSDVCSSDLRAGVDARPRALQQARQLGEHRGRVALARRRLAGRQADLAQRHGEAGDGIHQAEHITALVAEEFAERSEEHTSELQSLMRISYAVFCLKKKKN